jgi:hypothetical protein
VARFALDESNSRYVSAAAHLWLLLLGGRFAAEFDRAIGQGDFNTAILRAIVSTCARHKRTGLTVTLHIDDGRINT